MIVGTRRERVVLELDDQFSGKLARAAAAAEMFQRTLGKTRSETDRTSASLSKADRDTQKFSGTVTRSTRELDSYSGRLGLVATAIGAIGPAVVPITAVAIPAVTGLAQSFAFAAAAGGTAILAFQGVGDALGAMNKAHLQPTEANLEKAKAAMEELSPAAQQLVLKLESMSGEFKKLKTAAGSGILPGATAALDDLETRLPIVQKILHQISAATGQALREGAASLAGPEWDKFFHFIASQARPELTKLARTVGNLAHGFAELWIAFGPLNRTFSGWLLESARSFNAWATGLSKTQGFKDFVAYIRENGPRVGEAVAAIGNALVQIVEAAAPIGGPVLDALTAFANIIADIANSPLGTPIFGAVAAFSALSLASKAFGLNAIPVVDKFIAGQKAAALSIKATTLQMIDLNAVTARNAGTAAGLVLGNEKVAGSFRKLAGGAAIMGGLALASTGAADKVGLTHTQWLAMAGVMAGPLGAAVGASAGLLWDVADSGNAAADALANVKDALSRADFTAINAGLDQTTQAIEAQKNSVGGYLKLAFQGIDLNSWSGFNFDRTDLGKQIAERNALEQASGDLRLGLDTVGQETGLTSGFGAGLDDLAKVAERAKPAMKDLGISMDDLAQGARDGSIIQMGKQIDAWLRNPLNRAKMSADEFKLSIESAYAALSKRATMRDFEAAIDDATKSLKENGKTLDIGTAKGRNNQAALDAIATTALKVAENLDGVNRVRLLARARQEFIDTAVKMGMARDKAKELADRLIQTNKIKVKPTIDVDTSAANRELSAFEQQLQNLTGKSRTVYINEVHQSIFGTPAGGKNGPVAPQGQGQGVIAPGQPGNAGPYTGPPKKHAADGGLIRGPGGPRDDMIDARLSDREFVMQAASVDHYGVDFMHQVNAMRFADGGYVTRDHASRDADMLRYQSRQSHHSSSNKMTVSLGDIRVTGVLRSKLGPVEIEGIARAAAQDAVNDSAALDRTHAGMFRGGVRG